jgi:hypothetical protein
VGPSPRWPCLSSLHAWANAAATARHDHQPTTPCHRPGRHVPAYKSPVLHRRNRPCAGDGEGGPHWGVAPTGPAGAARPAHAPGKAKRHAGCGNTNWGATPTSAIATGTGISTVGTATTTTTTIHGVISAPVTSTATNSTVTNSTTNTATSTATSPCRQSLRALPFPFHRRQSLGALPCPSSSHHPGPTPTHGGVGRGSTYLRPGVGVGHGPGPQPPRRHRRLQAATGAGARERWGHRPLPAAGGRATLLHKQHVVGPKAHVVQQMVLEPVGEQGEGLEVAAGCLGKGCVCVGGGGGVEV